jgi:hypothetical protein
VPTTTRCPRCGGARVWRLRDGRSRCASCRYDFRPRRWPLRLDDAGWRAILYWYARGLPSEAIARESGVNRKRVLRALAIVRGELAAALARVAPRTPPRWEPPATVRGTPTPVIGIRFREGHPTAEVIAGVDGRLLARELRRATPRLFDWDPVLRPFAALVVARRLRRVSPVDPHPPHGHAELGAFWQYLERELSGRGGVRRDRLDLYLAEYSWRYRWRRWPPARRVAFLLDLIDRAAVSPPTLWGDVEKRRSNGDNANAPA